MSRTEGDNLRGAFSALARGRVEALGDVWHALSRPLHHYAFALTGDPETADDVLGEIMVRLARQGWRLRWVRSPKAYLYAAVRNAVRSQARQTGREGRAGAPAPPSPEQTEGATIRAAVLDLPGEQREAVVLHVWGGLTFREIGQLTGVPPNTAASRYRYALDKLRGALSGDDTER